MATITTTSGSFRMERKRQFKRSPVGKAVIRVIFSDEAGENRYSFSTDDWNVRNRRDITVEYVQAKVHEVVERKAEEIRERGLKVVGVDVDVVDNVWSTPFEDIYGRSI